MRAKPAIATIVQIVLGNRIEVLHDVLKLITADENDPQPTMWAKESPGPGRGLDPCDALGRPTDNAPSRVGVGRPPTPTRAENLEKDRLSTQGVAAGSRLRLLLFVRFALGYSPMAFQAIFMKVPHDLFKFTTADENARGRGLGQSAATERGAHL